MKVADDHIITNQIISGGCWNFLISCHHLKNPKLYKSWQNQIVTNLFYDELRKSQRKVDTVSLDEGKDDTPPIKLQLLDKKCKSLVT